MYNPVPQPIPLSEQAQKLQSDYAGHLLELRGYVTGSTLPEPHDKTLALRLDRYQCKVGDAVGVGVFPSSPLLAYVGNMRANIGTPVPDPGGFKIHISAPAGVREGTVRLRWPTTILETQDPLFIADRSFQCVTYDGPVGQVFTVGPFPDAPRRVFVAGVEVANFMFTNFVLHFQVLAGMQRGRILVVATEHTYLSEGEFNPV